VAIGILLVESLPASPDRADEYHAWYDEVHLRQILGVDGFRSARRFAPVDGAGPFVAIYEIEADDLEAAVEQFRAASRRGDIEPSDALQRDPPPKVRLLAEITRRHADRAG
jgi:hypothetical protein